MIEAVDYFMTAVPVFSIVNANGRFATIGLFAYCTVIFHSCLIVFRVSDCDRERGGPGRDRVSVGVRW